MNYDNRSIPGISFSGILRYYYFLAAGAIGLLVLVAGVFLYIWFVSAGAEGADSFSAGYAICSVAGVFLIIFLAMGHFFVFRCFIQPALQVGLAGESTDASDLAGNLEALRRREFVLEAIGFAAEQFLDEDDWEASVQAVLARLGEAIGASRVYLVENIRIGDDDLLMNRRFDWADPPTERSDWPGPGDVPYGPELDDWVKILPAGNVIHGFVKDFAPETRELFARRGVVSVAVVPIFVGPLWWGFIGYEDCKSGRLWSLSELDVLQTAASILGAAIRGENTNRELATARQQEITIGYEIQNRLLLGNLPQNLAGAQVAAISIPSEKIDGDFYDFIQYDRRHFDLIIGDVMGSGVSAALLGAATKTQFIRAVGNLVCSTNLATLPTPEEIVAFAHEEMCEKLITLQSLVTACVARFSLEKLRMDMVDCGHTGAIHFQAAKGACELVKGKNFPLGFSRDEVYEQISIHFQPGDILLFRSDGLVEIKSEDGESFGTSRLCRFIEGNSDKDARSMARDLYGELAAFAGTGVFHDDLTYIVVKIEVPHEPKLITSGKLEITSNFGELEVLREFVQDRCKGAPGVDAGFLSKLEIAVIEAASNIIRHAYGGRDDGKIVAEMDIFEQQIEIRLFYWGEKFGMMQMGTPAFDGSQSGGYGLYFIRHCVDEVQYIDAGQGKSCIRMVKMYHCERILP